MLSGLFSQNKILVTFSFLLRLALSVVSLSRALRLSLYLSGPPLSLEVIRASDCCFNSSSSINWSEEQFWSKSSENDDETLNEEGQSKHSTLMVHLMVMKYVP
ncbi:hypothetical protein ACET3Z_001650 [Daucus carota]